MKNVHSIFILSTRPRPVHTIEITAAVLNKQDTINREMKL